jgi:hypothetical protein
MKTIPQTKIGTFRSDGCKKGIQSIVRSALLICVSAIIFLYLDGCAPCYYAPGAQNVPLFNEAGDCNASGALRFGQYSIGADIQSAVAVTNHLGIMLNYSSYVGQDAHLSDQNETTSTSNLVEGGMGYYHPFDESFVFETYAGYSYASVKTDYDTYNGRGDSKLIYSSFFLQPAVGFCKEHIELALSTRFRVLDYTKYNCNDYTGGYLEQSLQEIIDAPATFMLEPAFTLRVGGERVKFQFQAGYSFLLNNPGRVEYDPLNLNFGLIVGILGDNR